MDDSSYKVEKLNGNNYQWKFSTRMYLLGKDLWDIVDGSEVLGENATEDEQKKFKKRENLAISLVSLSVCPSLHIYIRNAKSSKEAWESLANRFEEKTLSRKIHYRRKLYSARMEKTITMETHINNLKTTSEYLEALDDEVQEKDLVMILISSLPDEYNNLITTLESLKEDELTWTYVRDRLMNEFERKRGDQKFKMKEMQDALFVNKGSNQWKKNYNQGQGNTSATQQSKMKTDEFQYVLYLHKVISERCK